MGEPKKNRYRLKEDEIDILNNYRNLKQECKTAGIDVKNVKQYWFKSKHYSIQVKGTGEESISLEDINRYIDKAIKNLNGKKRRINPGNLAKVEKVMKVVISDEHVGMEPNPDGKGLFRYEYNADIYANSIDKIIASAYKEYKTHGKFEELIIAGLGDEQDGWNGYTTRGGHQLQQNMTNVSVFETCLDEKVRLIAELIELGIASKIKLFKVVNDNHSGDFGHIINVAVQKIVNTMFNKKVVEINTLTRFLEHLTYGDHCFVYTHGKDDTHMKRGLPFHLDDKTINYINKYIDHYHIDSKYIHVYKGDLHRMGYEYTTQFDYYNFMSLAPPSAWVQHNFGTCRSGYTIQVIPKHSNDISNCNYFIDYTKVKTAPNK